MRNHTTTADHTTPFSDTPPDTDATAVDPPRSRRRRRAAVLVGTAAAALLLWLVAGPALGINLDVLKTPDATTPSPVTAGQVLLSSVVAGLAGWALLAALEASSARGVTIWRWIAGTVALLSLVGPLTLAQSGGAAIVLTLLHVVVAICLLLALPGAARAGAGRTAASTDGATR